MTASPELSPVTRFILNEIKIKICNKSSYFPELPLVNIVEKRTVLNLINLISIYKKII